MIQCSTINAAGFGYRLSLWPAAAGRAPFVPACRCGVLLAQGIACSTYRWKADTRWYAWAQPTSKFAEAYSAGISKFKYWEPIYEDSLNLIAKLPAIAAHIYRCAGWEGVITNVGESQWLQGSELPSPRVLRHWL